MTVDLEGFVGDLVGAVNAHDLDALSACFAEDFVNETPAHPARSFTGGEQVRRNWAAIFAGIPDISATVTARALDGDVAWTEWRMDGHRRDGAEHHLRGVVLFTLVGRQARAARFYLEPLDDRPGDIRAAVGQAVGVAPGSGPS
jgi:ketosteroid isomerase-like protein